MADLGELEPDGLYHLATSEQWDRYQQAGWIAPDSLTDEGFVHCSWGHQVPGTVAKHFPDPTDLLALHLDPGRLGGELTVVEEDSYGSGQAFPHIYGAIPVSAVVAERSVR